MKTKITLNQVVLALWTINTGLVIIGATAVVLDQLNIL